MTQNEGVTPQAGSGLRPSGLSQSSLSQAEPLVPNAARFLDRWRLYADRLYRDPETRRQFETEYRDWYLAKFNMEPKANGADPFTFFPVWASYRMGLEDSGHAD